MFSVYRKELKLYFRTKSTYIILAILLVTAGVSTAILAPMGGLQFIPVYLTPVTLALIPLLQIFAERRQKRSGFENCYFAMGVSPFSLTVGRFLASLTVFLIPVLELAILPFILSAIGTLSYGSIYTSLLGYVLLMALVISLEQTLLAILPATRVGAICAYIPPVAMYIYHFLIMLLPVGEIPLSLMTAINPIGLFYAFTYGRFPIADFVALIAGTLLCLVLGVLFCRHRRGDLEIPARHRKAKALAAVVLVLTLCLSMGAALIPERLINPSVNNSKTFEIVAETYNYLEKLEDDVTIYYLVKGGKKSADIEIQYFLYNLADLSPHLRVKTINSEKETAFLEYYDATTLSDQSFIVVSNDRYILLDNNDLYHYYNADLQATFSPEQYAYYLSAYTNYLQTQSLGQYDENTVAIGQQLYTSKTTVAYFDGCARLTNAVHYVASEKVPTAKIYGSANAMDASLRAYLINGGYYFEEIVSPLNIGTNCDLLILHTPKTDITEDEAKALSSYLGDGGKVFLVTSCIYPNMPNLHSVTQKFGLDVLDVKNIVGETDKDYYYSAELPYSFSAHIASRDKWEITTDFDSQFVVITAHAIQIDDNTPDGVTVVPLLYTGEKTGALYTVDENGKLTKEESEEASTQYVCAAVAQKGEGTLLWLTSPESASIIAYNFPQTDNFTLIRSAMNWMTDNAYATVSVSSTLMDNNSLALDTNGVIVLGVILILVLPLALIIPSSVYLYKRKKR